MYLCMYVSIVDKCQVNMNILVPAVGTLQIDPQKQICQFPTPKIEPLFC
jgi:hypothetical protein